MSEPTVKDEKWMRVSQFSARQMSTCAKRKYFAILLDVHGHQIGSGWNGGPKGDVHCSDGGCPRFIRKTAPGSPYDDCISIHAEQNAFLHSEYSQLYHGTLIVNGPPCFTCGKMIVNAAIRRLLYIPDPSYGDFPRIERFLDAHGIDLVCFDGWEPGG